MANITATAEIDIQTGPQRVWSALTDPDLIEKYMFGTRVETSWEPGTPILWKGEYEGKPYEDKGTIVEVDPQHLLVMTHFSPLSGKPDEPGSYNTLRYEITAGGSGTTHLHLSQDNNGSEDEAAHATETWQTMLSGLKDAAESGS